MKKLRGPVLLLAVPGSGKTTVLVARLGYMIYVQKEPPENILVVTYTVAATRDMKQRFIELFGDEYAEQLTFRTINGLCSLVLRRYAETKGAHPFALETDESRLNAIVRHLLTETSGEKYPPDILVKDVRTHITYCKNMMLSNDEIRRHEVEGADFPAVYRAYQTYLRENRLMDFDDQLVYAYQVFRKYPDILQYFRQRWPNVCVDEAQDTSKIQHAILYMLSTNNKSLFMVGDEDQSIYGFRAAWPEALLDFEKMYPGATVMQMNQNFRSTQRIVQAADAFIQTNTTRRPKRMHTRNPSGVKVHRVELGDYNRQYEYLLKEARTCQKQTAVLYRNHDSAIPLIDLLNKEHVPFTVRAGQGFFFTSPLVMDITNILMFAQNETDADRFLSFYYKLGLRMKKKDLVQILQNAYPGRPVFERLIRSGRLEQWQEEKVRQMARHFKELRKMPAFTAIEYILEDMGYADYMKERKMKGRLDVLQTLAKQNPPIPEFLSRMAELKEIVQSPFAGGSDMFVLSTIHASKGLEYDRVILIDAVDGLFPPDPGPKDDAGQRALEEERRIFYVGATRAREELQMLSFAKQFGKSTKNDFTFISEMMGKNPPKKNSGFERIRRQGHARGRKHRQPSRT